MFDTTKNGQLYLTVNPNPFYDTVLGTLFENVPSKQIDYKKNKQGIYELKPPTQSVKKFSSWLKTYYLPELEPHYEWPLKGSLLFYAEITLKKKEYETKDVDNLAKALIDSMKGVVFEDDVQIKTLIINKRKMSFPGFIVAIKCLDSIKKPVFEIPEPYQ